MFNRRSFINLGAVASLSVLFPAWAQENQVQPVAQPKNPTIESLSAKILRLYAEQSAIFKSKGGLSQKEAQQLYISGFESFKADLKELGAPELPPKLDSNNIYAFSKLVDQLLAKQGYSLTYVIIKFGEDRYAINARLLKVEDLSVKEMITQFGEELGLKNLKLPKIHLVIKSLSPDVRSTDFFPTKFDSNFYGQTITTEDGQTEKILIFKESIAGRAKGNRSLEKELMDQTVLNELGNCYFRQELPAKLWDAKLSDKISVRHLGEAYSDYCSFHVTKGEVFIMELERILYSNNSSYLLSKAIVAKPMVEVMKATGLTDSEKFFNQLRKESPEELEQLKQKIIESYSENQWIRAFKTRTLAKFIVE